MAGIKKILLPEMAQVGTDGLRDVEMVIDNEPDIGAPGDVKNLFGHVADGVRWGIFCAQLDEIGAAIAELLRHSFGRATVQIGRINEGVEAAIRQRFHGLKITDGAMPATFNLANERIFPLWLR